MGLLGARLARAGFQVMRFSYHSVRASPVENALALQTFCQSLTSPAIHYVGHSLGGLVVRHLFHAYPQRVPGRVVTLGTPHGSSHVARTLARYRPLRALFGRSLQQGLLGDAPPWRGTHDLGVIAGTVPLGLGMLVPGIPLPHDGTVAVAETRLAGMKDHITLPASHTGLLLSAAVAAQCLAFLKTGRFLH